MHVLKHNDFAYVSGWLVGGGDAPVDARSQRLIRNKLADRAAVEAATLHREGDGADTDHLPGC